MRVILTSLFVLFISSIALAQSDNDKLLSTVSATAVQVNKQPVVRICTPSRGALMAPPLIVIFAHNKVIYKSAESSDILAKISPQSIKSLNILKDSLSTAKFGTAAKNGVIEIYLDDKYYPDVYKILKIDSAENKKK